MYVEIEFTANSIDWKVIRGIKPNVFEIYKNNELLDRNAAAADQQKWLEENVLKLNYKSFTQIVILGSASFVPFMQLPAGSRREIIEDLLDIKIFSHMSNILREKIRSTNDEIRELTIRRDLVEEKIDMQNNFIEELENRGKENIKSKNEKIKQNLKEQNDLLGVNELKNRELESVQTRIESFTSLTKNLRNLALFVANCNKKLQRLPKSISFLTRIRYAPLVTSTLRNHFA